MSSGIFLLNEYFEGELMAFQPRLRIICLILVDKLYRNSDVTVVPEAEKGTSKYSIVV